jgi:transcriptional regulator with XRE-family HTH domain
MDHVEPRERFAANLRRIRLERDLSQEALGDLAGLHRTEISLLERGLREPRLSTIVRVSRALKAPPSDLLKGVR